MNFNLDFSSQSLLGQLLIILISLLDDTLIVWLSHLGLNVAGLKWLSPIVITCTILYSGWQLIRHFRHSRSAPQIDSKTP
jgi:hypothetical protein